MGGVLKDTVVESPIKRTVKGDAKCVYFLKEVRYMVFFSHRFYYYCPEKYGSLYRVSIAFFFLTVVN